MSLPRRWVRPKAEPRICDRCGKTYHRRNRVESWSSQNPGHSNGWTKVILKICTRCADENTSRRILLVASVIRGGKK